MPKDRKNKYTCTTCRGEIVTVDLDEGVTPFALACRATPGCGGVMQSCFYTCDQVLKPSWVWFKPKTLKGLDAGTRDHVERGGLVVGRIPANRHGIDAQGILDPQLASIIEYIEGLERVSCVTLQQKFKLTYPAAARVVADLVRRHFLDAYRDGKGAHLVIKREVAEGIEVYDK
jgi:hypothetical protein